MSDPKQASWLGRLKFLVHPIAMGLYLTSCFAAVAFLYYMKKENLQNAGIFFNIIHDIDQKSLDYRLRLRGERPGDPRVAILAVDDRSVNIVGRWPWPRQTVANVFQNAFDAGAKVIAADIVWSEPSARPEKVLYQQVSETVSLPTPVREKFETELDQLDGDKAFSTALAGFADRFVLGNFYEGEIPFRDQDVGYGYVSACERIAFDISPAGKMWAHEEVPIIAPDGNDLILPDVMVQGYYAQFDAEKEKMRQAYPETISAQQTYELQYQVQAALENFCRNDFLDTARDPMAALMAENWGAILEADPSISAQSFEEWATNFKTTFLANQITDVPQWTVNIDSLASVGKHNGYFNATLDRDGSIRRSQLVARTGNYYVPSIALKAFLVAKGASAELDIAPNPKIIGAKGLRSIKINSLDTGDPMMTVPVNSDGRILINYAGPQKMFPYVSAADLVNPEQTEITIDRRVYDPETKTWRLHASEKVNKKEFLKDKILVAGATAIGIYDLRVTPFEENYPGVETHANVIDNLLRQDFLTTHSSEPMMMPLTLIALGILISLALSQLGALSGMLFTALLLVIVALVDKYVFFSRGILVSVAFPLLQISASYVFLTFYKYLTEERSKKELRQTFSKYVSPSIVEEILQDPKNLELGGRKETITVFFSDIRGFTTISEKLDPAALSDLLNSYLTPMTDIVFKHQGTLDKYMGDAVMAFFGAPIPFPNHAQLACRAALEQLEKLKQLQQQYAQKGLPMIDIGIGLNTGECSVGNMGSETVRNYTVMGDAVNLASRLEGINKEYGTHIIISEFTYEAVKKDFICREVDWVRVKGKLLPVKIYELLGEGKVDAKLDAMKTHFDDGYRLYREKRFEAAVSAFQRALEAHPEDRTSIIYIERCREYLGEPPPREWDGVYVMKTK